MRVETVLSTNEYTLRGGTQMKTQYTMFEAPVTKRRILTLTNSAVRMSASMVILNVFVL